MNKVIEEFLKKPASKRLKNISALIITAFTAGQPWG